jgi:hypothetical protein
MALSRLIREREVIEGGSISRVQGKQVKHMSHLWDIQ